MGQDDLRALLDKLPPGSVNADLLVGHSTNDDAAVLRIDGQRAIVQTVDFFTPIVDDPELFGAIAAANSVSDIYAMGAEPVLGLAIAMFPTGALPYETLQAILTGGVKKATEAGFPIAGGHTIIGDVPTYGLAVTGVVDVDKIVRNSTAHAGDRLYLTKPLGNGILVAAYRATVGGKTSERVGETPEMTEATHHMAELNRNAARAMTRVGVSAATDVTGYGLIGHLLEMCESSGVGAEIRMSAVPLLQKARELADRGVAPGGTMRNCKAFRSRVSGGSETDYRLLCDAQTSGGLLISIPQERAAQLEAELRNENVSAAWIGTMTDRSGHIEVIAS